MVPFSYLRFVIFLLAILIPACASYSPVYLMMYSAYKLNKQGDNIQPWHTALSIWKQSVVPCPNLLLLTCIQISQEAGQVVWYSHLLKIFHSLMWSTQSALIRASISASEFHPSWHHTSGSLWKTPLYVCRESRNEGSKFCASFHHSITRIVLTSQNLWKLRHPKGSHFGNCW